MFNKDPTQSMGSIESRTKDRDAWWLKERYQQKNNPSVKEGRNETKAEEKKK
jgi:hypothetical protein